MIEIRPLGAADEASWRGLWAEYNAFYRAAVSEAVTAETWRRLLDARGSILGRLAVEDDRALGFANAVIHEATWAVRPVCYLEDLYVAPAVRRRGIATALIEDLIRLGRARKWDRIYWHTEASNSAARRIYDRFVQADGFVRYRLPLVPE